MTTSDRLIRAHCRRDGHLTMDGNANYGHPIRRSSRIIIANVFTHRGLIGVSLRGTVRDRVSAQPR